MTRKEGTYNLHQPAMLVPNMWEEDDASIDEPAKVKAERGKEDHVVQEPPATAAYFYITFLSVAQREKNNKFDATAGAAEDDDGDRNEGAEDNHPGLHVLVAVVQQADHKAEGSKKKCHKHVFAVGVTSQLLFQLRKTEIYIKIS